MGSRPHLRFCACKTATLGPDLQVYMGSRPRHVDLCMQNNVLSTKITSLYGSQPSPVTFVCKPETLGPELQVSISPRPH